MNFYTEMSPRQKILFWVVVIVSALIWWAVNKLFTYILPDWIDMIVGIPTALILIILFAAHSYKYFYR